MANAEGKSSRRASSPRKASIEQRLDDLTRTVEELQEASLRIQAELGAINRKLDPPKLLRAQITRAQQSLDALVRRAYLDATDASPSERLVAQRFGLNSQAGEEGILLAILEEAGARTKRFVEFGSGINGGNSGVFARELGWSGLMVDGDHGTVMQCADRFESSRVRVVEAWLTVKNVNELLLANGVSGEIDVLSIDVDGNDLWVWEATTAIEPRIVVIEYNALFGSSRSVSIPYDPNFRRPAHLRGYFGASLAALSHLGRSKGFRLVAVEPFGANAFFLKEGLAPAIPALDHKEAFRPVRPDESIYPFRMGRGRVASPTSVFEEVERLGLALAEIPEPG
jgi:hypothetical protein